MEKNFQPSAIEQKHYQSWEQQGLFKPSGQGPAFSIMLPPPNVTGSLHMGHAFQQTIMDALSRYQRMRGGNVLWQPGTDHAGIATQMVVERQLAAAGSDRHQLGREAFIDKVWQWKEESGGTITQQMRRLGASVDWSRERFTMDPGLSEAVNEVFVQLHQQGLIYRGKRLVNWDPKLHTAISDLEVENQEEQGQMWHFRYPLANGATTSEGLDHIVVATTRPETMLGDSAVAVNPNDPRYQSLIGQQVMLPLVNRAIPIIADDYVEQDFGTGCVKITPAHDFNDYAVGKRHDAALINVFDADARILNQAEVFNYDGSPRTGVVNRIPEGYAGLSREQARAKIVADFEQQGLLAEIKPHSLMVPRGDRSGVIIEPWLTYQWYVSTKPLAEEAIKAVEDGRIEFIPKQWENTYYSWMRDIQDWCISRQLWWGHQIPAWYDEQGNVYVGRSEAEVRAAHQLDERKLTRDQDVLDTWFSSALWTFSTQGWPEQTPDLASFHPSSVLVTGFDIIFFWVARMIMMTMHFIKNPDGSPQVPFSKVYVTGLIRDEQGQKMSKSKGNVIDPIDLIDGISLEDLISKRTSGMMQPQLAEKISKNTSAAFPEGFTASGTDALRFTLTSLASNGRDIKFDVKRLEGYRNFCNKLWNASRYVLMNIEQQDCGQEGGDLSFSVADRWIWSALQRLIKDLDFAYGSYRFDLASQHLYEFVWNEFCDWYLELSKPVLWDKEASPEQLRGTRYTLLNVLEHILRLAHPMMPFISEEIWQHLPGNSKLSICQTRWPEVDESKICSDSEQDLAWLKQVILAVRNIRGEMNISPSKPLSLILQSDNPQDQASLQRYQGFIAKLAKLDSSQWCDNQSEVPLSATQIIGQLKVLVPMKGLIDVAAEQGRLSKEIEKLAKDVERLAQKLGNASFVDKAPAAVVQKEQEKLAQQQQSLAALREQFARLQELA